MFEMFQSVKTVVPVPQLGLASGAKGAIVDIYTSPYPAYEVEFFDDENGEPRKNTLTVDMTDAPEDSQVITTHFLDCLDGKAEPLMPVQRAAKHMEILFKILKG